MLDVLCLRYNCLDSCFVFVMFCALAHVYFLFFFHLFSSCVFVFATFERVLCLPSSTYRPVYCELMRCLRAVFHFSSMCVSPSHRLLFHVWELDTQLSVVSQTMRVCTGVVCSGTRHWRCWRCLLIESLGRCERHMFCLLGLVSAPVPPKALLAPKHFYLCFRYFYLVRGSLEIHSFWNDFICTSMLFA
jgi:hypothetical protein